MTGVTSRRLRHYDAVGLLRPTRTASTGHRHYDGPALVRLQRILLLRQLGLGLPAIARALDSERHEADALRAHLGWLESERERLEDQIASVRCTIRSLDEGSALMAQDMFGGFDHTQYTGEVKERWGSGAAARGDSWWGSLSTDEKDAFLQTQFDIGADFGRARAAGLAADSDEVQAIAERQIAWLDVSTRATTGRPVTKEYVVGLAEMYVEDPRFTATYDRNGEGTVVLVRDAMIVCADRTL